MVTRTLRSQGEAGLMTSVDDCGKPVRDRFGLFLVCTAHVGNHVGQIVYVAKQHCGPAWRTLSIPRGGSAQFNQQPRHYLDHGGNASPSM